MKDMNGSKWLKSGQRSPEQCEYVAMIERSIGRQAGRALLQLKPYIKSKQEADVREEKDEGAIHRCTKTGCLKDIDVDEDKILQAKLQREKIEKLAKREQVAAAYLQNMSGQRKWFSAMEKKFCNDHGTDSKLRSLFKQGRQELEQQLDFMLENKPPYHMKHKYRESEPFRKKKNLEALTVKSEIMQQLIEQMFDKIIKFYGQRKMKKCVDEADRIKTALEKVPMQLPLNFIHKSSERLANWMGLVYLRSKELQDHLTDEENMQRIVGMLGLDSFFNELKFDAILQSSSFPFFDGQAWRDKYKRFLKICESDLEKAWLHYEVARSYESERNWKQVQVHGHKTAVYGKRSGSSVWQINGHFLEAVVAGKDSRHNLTHAALQDCINVAEKTQYYETFVFLKTAQEAVAVHKQAQFQGQQSEQSLVQLPS